MFFLYFVSWAPWVWNSHFAEVTQCSSKSDSFQSSVIMETEKVNVKTAHRCEHYQLI